MVTAADVLTRIPYGRDNAVSRAYLSAFFNAPDRVIRKAIQQARTEGYIIINDSTGNGYYRTNDIDQIARQYRTNRSRAMAILVQQKHLRRLLKEAGREV